MLNALLRSDRGSLWLTAGLAVTAWSSSAQAECPCQNSTQMVLAQTVANPEFDPGVMLPPQPDSLLESMTGAPAPGLATPGTFPLAVAPGVNRFAVSPPPGTLGQTYQRRSTLIPDDKHPRIGMVDVYLPEDVDVSARGMKSKWTGKVWRLETNEPLVPGVRHIYAIKAEQRDKNGEVTSTEVRWIRLIMGRIVELEF